MKVGDSSMGKWLQWLLWAYVGGIIEGKMMKHYSVRGWAEEE